MMENVTVNSGPGLAGLRTIDIENSLVRIVVLPEAGGRIRQITYKPLAADLLWNNPGLVPSRQPVGAAYDDVWSGGWDELFPNDEAGTLEGDALPDHGELWTGDWQAEPFNEKDAAGVRMRFSTPLSHFDAEKTVRLRPGRSAFEVSYRLTNRRAEAYPFLFKLHPAFAVSGSHRIDFPPMTVVREPEFAGTLGDAPLTFPWPLARLGEGVTDLRQVPDAGSGEVHFFYGAGIEAGWCGITNRANGLASALRFDPKVFSSCWLFATYGGWKDLNVAVLEPATGYPLRVQSQIEEGRARWLASGESLETTVLFSAQEGFTSMGGVDADGRIVPGE